MTEALARRAEFELAWCSDEVRLVCRRSVTGPSSTGSSRTRCARFYATARNAPRPNPAEVASVHWLPWGTSYGGAADGRLRVLPRGAGCKHSS